MTHKRCGGSIRLLSREAACPQCKDVQTHLRFEVEGILGHRSAQVYFRYLDAAASFARLARREGFLAADPDRSYYRLNDYGGPISHPYEPVTYQGFRVLALV